MIQIQHCLVSSFNFFPQKVICSLLGCPASSVVLSILKHSGIVATLAHSKVNAHVCIVLMYFHHQMG